MAGNLNKQKNLDAEFREIQHSIFTGSSSKYKSNNLLRS